MARTLMKPITDGTKVNYYLAFDMYPKEDDDVVIPEEPTPDTPNDEDDEIIWDGGSL